ncbi:MAG: cytoplasmic protein [Deltaproteobacteria bacterium]|nr:cytoplasmic protein [Deltaproteobacteria bacterium]
MSKYALFVFNGDSLCIVHVLLNALDMHESGIEVTIVVEGAAVRLVPELGKTEHQFHGLFNQARSLGLFAGACRACSAKLGVQDGVSEQGLELIGDMKGHPSMRSFQERGYRIITF